MHPISGGRGDVSDPIGGPLEQYRRCAEQLDAYLEAWVEKLPLEELPAATPQPDLTRASARDFLDADHHRRRPSRLSAQAAARPLALRPGPRGHRRGHDLRGEHRLSALRRSGRPRKFRQGQADRGILVCGTGVGMCITANKVRGVRATVAADETIARVSRQHNNVNVLCMGEQLAPQAAQGIVQTWLATEFEGGRHNRRVDEIAEVEQAECSASIAR